MLDPQADCFRPPSIPTEVGCLHCGQEYNSYLIEWRIETTREGKKRGFWCCPTEGCDGVGFGFDILPVDPEWEDPDGRDMGWCMDDEDEDFEEYDDEAELESFDEDGETLPPEAYPIHDAETPAEDAPEIHLHPQMHPVDLMFVPPWVGMNGPPAVIDLGRCESDPQNSPFIYEQIDEDDIPF